MDIKIAIEEQTFNYSCSLCKEEVDDPGKGQDVRHSLPECLANMVEAIGRLNDEMDQMRWRLESMETERYERTERMP